MKKLGKKVGAVVVGALVAYMGLGFAYVGLTTPGEAGFIPIGALVAGFGLLLSSGIVNEEGIIGNVLIWSGGTFLVIGLVLGLIFLTTHYEGPCRVDPVTKEVTGPYWC